MSCSVQGRYADNAPIGYPDGTVAELGENGLGAKLPEVEEKSYLANRHFCEDAAMSTTYFFRSV